MREIKFRGWNGRTMIHYPNWFTVDEQETLVFNAETEPMYVDSSDINWPSKVNLMEYTGLKDKNGKEIYEGDVVAIPLYGNTIIIWNEGICAFQFAYRAHGKGTSIDGRMTNTLYAYKSEKDYEVVGNIHQNPELLANERNPA